MPGIPGGWELVLLLGVLVLLFGASKLPNAARSIGQSMRIFKAETKSMRPDDDQAKDQSGATTQQDRSQEALPPSAQPGSSQPTDASRPTEQPHRPDTTR